MKNRFCLCLANNIAIFTTALSALPTGKSFLYRSIENVNNTDIFDLDYPDNGLRIDWFASSCFPKTPSCLTIASIILPALKKRRFECTI